jgi:hypothetical protein
MKHRAVQRGRSICLRSVHAGVLRNQPLDRRMIAAHLGVRNLRSARAEHANHETKG